MKAVDPSILVIPNGDSDEFFKTVINKAGNYIDRLCVSNYGVLISMPDMRVIEILLVA